MRRSLVHPDWVTETLRGVLLRRREARPNLDLGTYSHLFVTEEEAVARVTRATAAEYRAVSRELDGVLSGSGAGHPLFGARAELLRMVASIVRLTRPATMVETGVAQGLTSLFILESMESSGTGHLHSVDLPLLHVDDAFVGRLVPGDLRARWDLRLGPSRKLLGPLLRELGPIDVFLHDAEHSYESQLQEYRTAWPALRDRGILVSDDVMNAAFVEFASEVDATPLLVPDPSGISAVGLLRKGQRE